MQDVSVLQMILVTALWNCSQEKWIVLRIKAVRHQSVNSCHLSEILRSAPFEARKVLGKFDGFIIKEPGIW